MYSDTWCDTCSDHSWLPFLSRNHTTLQDLTTTSDCLHCGNACTGTGACCGSTGCTVRLKAQCQLASNACATLCNHRLSFLHLYVLPSDLRSQPQVLRRGQGMCGKLYCSQV